MFNKRPCPFCGGTSQELSLGKPDPYGTPCGLNCTECGAVGPWDYVASDATPGTMLFEAAKKWDEREPGESELRALETPLPPQTELELRERIEILTIARAKDSNLISELNKLIARLNAENSLLAKDLYVLRVDRDANLVAWERVVGRQSEGQAREFFSEVSQLLNGWKQGCGPGEWSDWDESILQRWNDMRMQAKEAEELHPMDDGHGIWRHND